MYAYQGEVAKYYATCGVVSSFSSLNIAKKFISKACKLDSAINFAKP